MEEKKRLICIGGPTASGKTALAISLAQKYKTEIISVDSRQLYREMNIGTAKPTSSELALIPHHFINHVSVHQHYDIGIFEKEVLKIITEKFKHTDILIAAGGSGLYFKAIIEGIDEFPEVGQDITSTLQKEYQEKGLNFLQQLLKDVDPDYYKTADINNPVRLIRAISMYQATGFPFSSFRTGNKISRFFETHCYYLSPPRDILYEKINTRVEKMITDGLIEEARTLYEYKNLKALQTVGYSELFKFFSNEYDINEAISKIKQHTRQYAKRQLTWFNNVGNWKKWENQDVFLF
ncbi:MAG: tRNA (adenosine(37)-N6)-dimethylallyltransferase MiaA [Bacteroidota bacterium]